MNVEVVPLPSGYRILSRRLWPQHPPIFPGGEPTTADRELAIELIEALDPESRDWYASALARLRSLV